MKNLYRDATRVLAGAFILGLTSISQVAVADEDKAVRSTTEQPNSTNKSDKTSDNKSNNSGSGKKGASQDNAAPDEWEKAKGLGQKKKGGSTGGDTGTGSSSSQGSSTSGTSSGSGGY